MAYSIVEHKTVQVIEVQSLYNELDNKLILKDIQNRIENGYKNSVVDLSKLDFMNSVGLNFLIATMTKSKDSGGKMAVVNASAQVLKLLEITKLRELFNLHPTVEKAIEQF